jgi:type 1 glutamine amidotransferase
LRQGMVPLLKGTVEGKPSEPVAWTHSYHGGRVLYTSLGHPNDFKVQSFQNLLRNAIEWTLNRPLEKKESK